MANPRYLNHAERRGWITGRSIGVGLTVRRPQWKWPTIIANPRTVCIELSGNGRQEGWLAPALLLVSSMRPGSSPSALVAFAGKIRPQPGCIPVRSARHVARKQSGCSVHVTLRIPLDMMYFFLFFLSFFFLFFFHSTGSHLKPDGFSFR